MASILILDDDYEQASKWKAALVEYGHHVDISLSLQEGVAYVERTEYDLCIVDLVLKVAGEQHHESGREFVKFLKDQFHQTGKKTQVIGVSGFAPFGDGRAAKSVFAVYGTDGFLRKPFENNVLVDTVHGLL